MQPDLRGPVLQSWGRREGQGRNPGVTSIGASSIEHGGEGPARLGRDQRYLVLSPAS